MVKVLYIIDTLQSGGAERSLFEITSRFHHTVPVFLVIYQGDQHLLPLFQKSGIDVYQLEKPKKTAYSEICRQIEPLLEKIRPDVIHASLFHAEMVARKLDYAAPLVNSLINNSYHTRRYSGLGLRGKTSLLGVQLMDLMTASKVDLFIANSAYMSAVHQKALRLPAQKIKVIPRGRNVHASVSLVEAAKQKLKEDLNSKGSQVFLNVGRLLDRKGQLELIQAFHIVHLQTPQTKLWIAGKGTFQTVLEKQIKQLNLKDHVFLLGNRDDLTQLLAVADYFVFPSRYEGLPGALIEAMLAKIPIIASDIPENRECVNDHMVLFHQVRQVADLAQSMQDALYIKDWHVKTELAYTHAVTHFNIENISCQYEAAYLELLQKKQKN